MTTGVIKLDAAESLSGGISAIAPAARALRAGKLVGFPTESVYGVAALAASAQAMRRLRAVKGRPSGPFTVHLSAPAEAGRYVCRMPLRARGLLAKAWPGPVTLLLPTGGRAAHPEPLDKAVYGRIVKDGVVGLRCPSHPVARALLAEADGPVVAPSANLPGRPPATTAEEALAQLDGRIDVLIDAGPTCHRKPSTIVAFEGEDLKVVRAGAFPAGDVRRMARLDILFVCTGNTCRSPLAEALAKKLLAERLGVEVAELGKVGVTVTSAGSFSFGSVPASPNAVVAVQGLGGDLRKHRSRKLTNELIQRADLVFCMTQGHVAAVTRRVRGAAGKTFLLDACGDISDPIGGDADQYLRVGRRIQRALRKRMKENWL